MATREKREFVNPTKIVTGVCRLSYANIWQAKSINGGAPKFSTSVLIPKSDTTTVAKVKAAIAAAYIDGEAKLKGNGKSVTLDGLTWLTAILSESGYGELLVDLFDEFGIISLRDLPEDLYQDFGSALADMAIGTDMEGGHDHD